MECLVSECCGATHDERFSFDDEWNMGLCSQCLDHATFVKEKDF